MRSSVMVVSVCAIAACGGSGKPPAKASSSSTASCGNYIDAISEAALAIGDAGGREQVYDAVANSNLRFASRFTGDLTQAQRDVAAATAKASALGQPPASCGSLSRETLTKPGIAAAQGQAIRKAYGHVGSVAGGADAQQFRSMADASYPEAKVSAQRAAYDALVKRLKSENP